jgi:hypothetical protein
MDVLLVDPLEDGASPLEASSTDLAVTIRVYPARPVGFACVAPLGAPSVFPADAGVFRN